MVEKACTIDGCTRRLSARGWCQTHYMRWRNYGDPLFVKRVQGTPEARFWSLVDAGGVCWEWIGFLRDGYGRFQESESTPTISAHRWAYGHLCGPISPDLELDHLCRNRRCVNPDHLEPVTKVINGLRGNSPHAINARKTHCHQGHPFTEGNTYIENGGGRRCRECRRAAYRTRTAKPNEVMEN